MQLTNLLRSIGLPQVSVRAGFGASAATWVLLQQAFVRALVAAKFLLLGRILGPAAIGSIGVALLAIAIAESLSDTGLAQAIVQGRNEPTRAELGAVLTTLATRGLCIALCLFLVAPVMASAFHLGGALMLLQLAALPPLIRGLASPAYFVTQRERRFAQVAGVEVSVALLDCCSSIGMALGGIGAYSALVGAIAGETLKTTLTWTTMTPRPQIRLSWSGIGHYIRFSRWIWASSVVSLLLNQFDKVIVARLLGPSELGAYQMSSRLAQMLLADAAIAMSQYLFPTFSANHRRDPGKAALLVKRYLALATVGLAAIVLLLRAFAAPFLSLLLGQSWLVAVPLFRIFVVNMSIGALIAVLVAYLRAVGDAKAATHGSLLQVIVLAVTVPIATKHYGVVGLAWSMTAGLGGAAALMLYRLMKRS
ncbi:oligosaccharide flippase family protein [Trinickia sp. EG282A]|uniref:oligosaccharide flippase family protein n=1 Tax=Trinickia sp. EG282A TaxID=3237013 RepID=UPI0034D15AEC